MNAAPAPGEPSPRDGSAHAALVDLHRCETPRRVEQAGRGGLVLRVRFRWTPREGGAAEAGRRAGVPGAERGRFVSIEQWTIYHADGATALPACASHMQELCRGHSTARQGLGQATPPPQGS